MSLAWGTLSLILLVLPGFATLFGFYSHSRLSGQLRDVTPKSQAGEIAMVVFLSFAVHLLMFVMAWLGPFAQPFEAIGDLLDYVAEECFLNPAGNCVPSVVVASFPWGIFWVAAYILFTSATGFAFGSLCIKVIEEQRFGIELKRFHSWSYDLIAGRLKPTTQVTVLTSNERDGCWVEYQGGLDQMTLDAEQKVTTVLLKDVTMRLIPTKRPEATTGDGVGDEAEENGKAATCAPLPVGETVMIPGARILSLSYAPPLDIDKGGEDVLKAALQSGPVAA